MYRMSIGDRTVCFFAGLSVLGFCIAFSGMPQALAVDRTWNGATSNFETGSNWLGGTAPANDLTSDTAVFGPKGSLVNPSLTTDREIHAIKFTDGGWTLGGAANTLSFGAGGVNYISDSTATNFITANIELAVDSTWIISRESATVTTYRTLQVDGVISGSGGFTKTGKSDTMGNVYGTLILTAPNTYTGQTILDRGGMTNMIRFNSIANVGGSPSALGAPTTVADGTIKLVSQVALYYTGSGHSTDRQLELAGYGGYAMLYAHGSGPLTWNGDVVVTGSDTKRLALRGTSTAENAFNGRLSDGTVRLHLQKWDTGHWKIGNDSNNFTGATNIAGGTLSFTSLADAGVPSALGAPTGGNATISVGSTTQSIGLRYTGSGNSSTNRMIALPGTTGPITITADGAGTIRFTNTNPMPTPGAGSKTLTFNGTNTGENLFAIGIIDNSSTNTTSVAKSGTGTWVLSGDNIYTGTTTVSGGTLIATKPAALPGHDAAGKVSTTASGATLGVRAGAAGEWTSPEITTLLANASFATGSNLGIDVTAGNSFDHVAGIGGGQGLVKLGTGTLILSGANSYTGNTTVHAGVLRAAGDNPNTLGTGPSQLILNGGMLESFADTTSTINYGRNVVVTADTSVTVGRLTPGSNRTMANRQFGTLSIGNATLTPTLDATNNTSTDVNAAITFGDTTLTGNATFALNPLWHPTWSSHATLNLGSITDSGAGYGFSTSGQWYYTNLIANGTIDVSGNVTVSGPTLRAVGDWSTHHVGGNINLAGGVLQLSGNLTRPLGAGDGQIRLTSGSAGFSTYGGGSNVTVDLTDPFTGQSAELVWGSADFRPSTFVLAVGTGASAGQLEVVNPIDFNGAHRTFNLYAGSAKLSGVLSNSHSSPAGLIKHTNGSGTLWLANDGNTFDGPIEVRNAMLQFESVGNVGGDPSSLGAPTTAASGLISLGSATRSVVLRHTGSADSSTDRMIALPGTTGPVAITADGAGTLRFTNTDPMPTPGAGAKTLTFNGTNTGDNLFAIGIVDNSTTNTTRVVKSGTGTWVLAGDSAYTGSTTVSSGVLKIAHANALGSTDGPTTVASGATLGLQGGIITAAEPLTLNGNGVASGGTLRNFESDNTYSGPITLAGAARINSDSSTLTLTGGVSGSNTNLSIGGAGNTTIASAITTGAGSLTKDGDGMVILSAANTYSGATSVNAGVLRVTNSGALGSTGAGTTVANFASVEVHGGITVAEPITITGGGYPPATSWYGALRSTGGNNTWSGPVALGGSARIGIRTNETFTLTGGITGSASVSFAGAAGGTIRIANTPINITGTLLAIDGTTSLLDVAGSSWGNTTISYGGTLKLGLADAMPGSTVVTIGSANHTSGTLDLNGHNQTIAGLIDYGNGTRRVINSGSGTPTLTVNNANDYTYAGALGIGAQSGFSLTKKGNGVLTLSGNNTYTGPTTVEGGTLALSHASSNNISGSQLVCVDAAGTLDVTGLDGGKLAVAAGQTLGGRGTVHGAVDVLAAAALSPGMSLGTLSLTGDLTLHHGAEWIWEFLEAGAAGDDYDSITCPNLVLPETGKVNLNISALAGYQLSAGDSFTLFQGDVFEHGASAPFAFGADLKDYFHVTDNIGWWGTWEVSAGSLVLTAVPEPGTWLMLVFGLTFGLLVRWRR